jgi:signal transduction histidine kinase
VNSGSEKLELETVRAGSGWPFLPMPVLVVFVLSLLSAVLIGAAGLTHLARASDRATYSRVHTVAEALAARVRVIPTARQADVVALAARRAEGLEMLLLERSGTVLVDATSRTPSPESIAAFAKAPAGETESSFGRAFYVAVPLELERVLVVIAPAPARPERVPALVKSLVALTVLLLLVAGSAAYSVSYDSLRDVLYVTDRIHAMVRVSHEPAGESIPARTTDEVAALTVAFNELRARFDDAEQVYRSDLERARTQDENRSKFLAAVSHELRSPLHAILGFADVLLKEVDGPLNASAREDIEQIRESGDNLATLIGDIVEFSALEGGQLKLSLASMDLLQLAAEVVRESQGLIKDKPVRLYLVGAGSFTIRADAPRVRQILSNLIGNAIKFTKEGEVRVKVWREQTNICVSVLDTGVGIREEDRAVIFEEYKQTSHERVLGRGTGLGLAITRRLVALHGAKLKLASEVGRGSEFRVLFAVEAS